MRTFIAIDFPTNTLNQLGLIIDFFKQQTTGLALKWVNKSNLHLTINFLGEIDKDVLLLTKKSLSQALADVQSFTFQISGLGMFPNKNQPRVIWLGVNDTKPLIEIHRKINRNLQNHGISSDFRPFSPHLTIARVRQNAGKEIGERIGNILSNYQVDPLDEIKIDQVHLYKSVLNPTGPVYSILHTVHLNQV